MKYSSNDQINPCTNLDLLKQYGFLGRTRGPTLIPNLIWGYLNFLVAQMVTNTPAMQETWVWSLGREDSLEKGMATHSSIHAWKISWMEPGGYSPWGHKESVMGYHGSCYGSFLGKHVAQRNMFFQFHIFGRLLDYLQQILMSFSCANLFLMLFLLTVFTTSFFCCCWIWLHFPPYSFISFLAYFCPNKTINFVLCIFLKWMIHDQWILN